MISLKTNQCLYARKSFSQRERLAMRSKSPDHLSAQRYLVSARPGIHDETVVMLAINVNARTMRKVIFDE